MTLKLPSWVEEDGVPALGNLDDSATRRLLEAAARGPRDDDELKHIVAFCEGLLASDFLWVLMERWRFRGHGESMMRNLFAWLATDEDVARLGKLLRSRGAWTDQIWARIAPRHRALELLAAVDTPLAWLEVARFRDQTQVDDLYRSAGSLQWDRAKRDGLGPGELNRLCAPTLGFDNGRRTFDLGSRRVDLVITQIDDIHFEDSESNRRLAHFPRRTKSDDATAHAAARLQVAEVRTQLDEVLQRGLNTLEHAMVAGRRWRHTPWRQEWYEHPILRSATRNLVWLAHIDVDVVPFMLDADHEPWAPSSDTFNLDRAWAFELAHPAQLDVVKWSQHLADLGLIQSIAQIERGMVRPSAPNRLDARGLANAGGWGWQMRAHTLGRARDMFVLTMGDYEVRATVIPGLAVTTAGRVLHQQEKQALHMVEVHDLAKKRIVPTKDWPARIQIELNVLLARCAAT